MTVAVLMAVVRRQRMLLAALLLVAVLAGVLAAVLAPARYASGAVVVVRSPILVGPRPKYPFEGSALSNPMIHSEAGINDVARVLIDGAGDSRTTADDVTVTVSDGTMDPTRAATSPFVVIGTDGPDPIATREAAASEIALLTTALRDDQVLVGVPDRTFMTLQTVVAPAPGARAHAAPVRTGLGITATGTVLALLVVFARDSVRRPVPDPELSAEPQGVRS